jgi:hypothetical protein
MFEVYCMHIKKVIMKQFKIHKKGFKKGVFKGGEIRK